MYWLSSSRRVFFFGQYCLDSFAEFLSNESIIALARSRNIRSIILYIHVTSFLSILISLKLFLKIKISISRYGKLGKKRKIVSENNFDIKNVNVLL